jgi:hypothetical protein
MSKSNPFVGSISRLLRKRSQLAPRVIVFGDSHTASLIRAQEFNERNGAYRHIEIFRLKKTKGEGTIGDIETDVFLKTIENLTADDYIFSAVGGNQYAVISTIRPSPPFTFASDGHDTIEILQNVIIPRSVISQYLSTGIYGSDGKLLDAITKSTKAKIVHLIPPPPKQSNDFIKSSHETRFKEAGLDRLGVSSPELRIKCWKLQREILHDLCDRLGIAALDPPQESLAPGGFLDEFFYGKDATHANRRYGELVLKQIVDFSTLQTTRI